MAEDRIDRAAREPIPVGRRLDRLVREARLALAWETAWPALWIAVGTALAFLIVSWLGIFLDLPPVGRMVGLGVLALGLAAAAWRLPRLALPSRAAALDRVDRDSPHPHRPARTMEDALALGGGDAGSRALWALHRRRAETSLAALAVARPRPGMARRDPHALRAAALLAAVAAAFVAGPEIWPRLLSGFDWRGAVPPATAFRIDGWIDPPIYTRLPPLMIDLTAGEQRLKAPVGSTVVVRMAGQGEAVLEPGRGLVPGKPADQPREGLREQRYTLKGSAELAIGTGLAAKAGLPPGPGCRAA